MKLQHINVFKILLDIFSNIKFIESHINIKKKKKKEAENFYA